MGPVGIALQSAARMCVNIGDDGNAARFACIPQVREISTVETNNAGGEAVRVQIIVEQVIRNPRSSPGFHAE
jgi:hypothetical protein